MQRKHLWKGLLVLPMVLVAGCGATDDETTTSGETVSEMAGASVAGAAQSTESSGVMAAADPAPADSMLARLGAWALPSATAANPACPTLATASCSGSTITLTYNSCSFGTSLATWNGSQILTFTSGSCTTTPQSASVTFTRTFGSGTTRTGANGVVVAMDTSTASGWSSSVSGGTTIASNGSNRTVTINGVHLTASKTFTTRKGVSKTVTVWDHTISTPAGVTITGSGAGRTVTGGSIQVQHNLAKYVGTATIAQALTFSAGCCHPTGGKISTTLTGGLTGTETLTYSSTCGQATLVDSSGASSTVTLSHCL